MNAEKHTNAIKNMQKKPAQLRNELEHCYRYRCLLRKFAYNFVSNEINKIADYDFTRVDDNSAHSVVNGLYIYATMNSCNCIRFKTMRLPCKHIFCTFVNCAINVGLYQRFQLC